MRLVFEVDDMENKTGKSVTISFDLTELTIRNFLAEIVEKNHIWKGQVKVDQDGKLWFEVVVYDKE